MPLRKITTCNRNISWALWHIEETATDLWQELNPAPPAQYEYQAINHQEKRLEWLASRLVVKILVEHLGSGYQGIYKDAFGKPHLHQLQYHISIAHCFPLAVGAIHQHNPVGIDIERPRAKLLRIRDRFLGASEAQEAGDDLNTLCKFWCSKEVLYKIYGRKKLTFKEHIRVSLENPNLVHGRISIKGHEQSYQIQVEEFEGLYIATGV